MRKIKLSKRADKILAGLPAKQGRQIAQRLQALASDPASMPSIELKGCSPWLRVRSGEYRIIFYTDETHLHVGLVGKRNDDEGYRLVKRFLKYTAHQSSFLHGYQLPRQQS